jgi:hypothetical protein
MPNGDALIAVARRHVQQAEHRVARQKALIRRLEEHKHASSPSPSFLLPHAEMVLVVLERSLQMAREHLQLEITYHGRGPKTPMFTAG